MLRETPLRLPDRRHPAAFEQLVDSWLGTHTSANTRSAYGSDLASFGRWCAGNEAIPLAVTAADVVAYQTACDDAGDSPATIRRRTSALSSFFQFAVGRDAADANPVAGSSRPLVAAGDPSPTPTLGPAVVEEHLRAAAELDDRLHALVALLALDGLKLGEALALDVGDVTGRPPKVHASVTRNGREHRLALHPESAAAVRRCAAGRADGPLIVSGRPATADADPARLTRFGADHLIKRLPSHRDVPLTANALRRFYVTSSHDAGVHIDAIRERAGLGDARSARRYLSTNTNQTSGLGSGRRASKEEV